MPRSSRSAEEKSRRAAEDRGRRAAEAPLSRQVRLDSDKASTRRRRQTQTLESSITAKRRNSRMRAEFVVRLQMSLRLGVRAVTPLIATLLSNFFCSEHPIHCARPT